MTHPTEEELALHHAGLLPAPAAQKVKAHVSTCARCRRIVEDAARGLAILASASEPPADLLQHARARRWATKGDATPIGLPFEGAEDIAEVSGRGLEADETQTEKPDDANESDDEGEQ
jgi:anti-sigma factor ChrR (cupin superfamily)